MPATKILWGQITIVMLVVLLTTWSATEGVAWQLAFQPELGAPWFRVVRRARQRITADMPAPFVRFWLTITPPLPEEAQSAAQIKGRERFDGLSRRSSASFRRAAACCARFRTTLVGTAPESVRRRRRID